MTGGGCLCGAVRFEVAGKLRPVVICHCGQCRRQTGLALASTAARRTDIRFLEQGGLRWFHSSPGARRGFCAGCGSVLFWDAPGRDIVSIAAGSLDDGSSLEVACHIHAADKAQWETIADGLPVHAGSDYDLPPWRD